MGLTLITTLLSAPADARDTGRSTPQRSAELHRGVSRIFVTGASPGDPSPGKLATIYTLYAMAAASLAVSGVAYFAHVDARRKVEDFLEQNRSPAPCFDLASLRCEELERLRGDERRNGTLASVGLAGAGTFLLSGLFAAQYWSNVQPALSTSGDGASFHVRVKF